VITYNLETRTNCQHKPYIWGARRNAASLPPYRSIPRK